MTTKKPYNKPPYRFSTIENLRTWTKNLWLTQNKFIRQYCSVEYEEDYYYLLDDNFVLYAFLESIGQDFEIIDGFGIDFNFEIYLN